MKRRTFLRMLGIAPVAAAVPAMALPRPEKPHELDKLVIDVSGPDPEALRRLRSEIAEGQSKWLEDIKDATGPHSGAAARIDNLAIDLQPTDQETFDRLAAGAPIRVVETQVGETLVSAVIV